MSEATNISHTSALVLKTINAGYMFGFDIMEKTGLPSGTIYPALRRLEENTFIRGTWENTKAAASDNRPRRRYYRLTRNGKDALSQATRRYPLLAQLMPGEPVIWD
jgi:DNA-binding PadR family transcriptional regulator